MKNASALPLHCNVSSLIILLNLFHRLLDIAGSFVRIYFQHFQSAQPLFRQGFSIDVGMLTTQANSMNA